MKIATLAISTAALAFSGAALAENHGSGHAKPMGDMTRAQAQQQAEARFARMDANRDGTVNDADRAARQAGMFDRIDTDRNGAISRAEFETHHAQMGDRRGDRVAKKGDRRAGMRGKMGKMDGPVTKQAFVERALGMFDRADANRDGTVTQAERKAVRDNLRQQSQARKAAGQQG